VKGAHPEQTEKQEHSGQHSQQEQPGQHSQQEHSGQHSQQEQPGQHSQQEQPHEASVPDICDEKSSKGVLRPPAPPPARTLTPVSSGELLSTAPALTRRAPAGLPLLIVIRRRAPAGLPPPSIHVTAPCLCRGRGESEATELPCSPACSRCLCGGGGG